MLIELQPFSEYVSYPSDINGGFSIVLIGEDPDCSHKQLKACFHDSRK